MHPHEVEEQGFGRDGPLWDADPTICCAAFQLGACRHTEGDAVNTTRAGAAKCFHCQDTFRPGPLPAPQDTCPDCAYWIELIADAAREAHLDDLDDQYEGL